MHSDDLSAQQNRTMVDANDDCSDDWGSCDLVGTASFTDGYGSFYLQESLVVDKNSIYHVHREMTSDGIYMDEYAWVKNNTYVPITDEQARLWIKKYNGKDINIECRKWDTRKYNSYFPEDLPLIFTDKCDENLYFLKLEIYCDLFATYSIPYDPPLFFGEFYDKRTIWPTKQYILKRIKDGMGIDHRPEDSLPEGTRKLFQDIQAHAIAFVKYDEKFALKQASAMHILEEPKEN